MSTLSPALKITNSAKAANATNPNAIFHMMVISSINGFPDKVYRVNFALQAYGLAYK
jgi:hypothetical protein